MSVMYSFLSFSSFMNNKVVNWIIAIIGLKYCNIILAVIYVNNLFAYVNLYTEYAHSLYLLLR